MHKLAIELQEGDEIVTEGTFPQALYAGKVKSVVAVDSGAQITLSDGGTYIRPENHVFEIKS